MKVNVILILHVVLLDEDFGVVQVQLNYLKIILVKIFYLFQEVGILTDERGWDLVFVDWYKLEIVNLRLIERQPLILREEVVDHAEAVVEGEDAEVLGLDVEDCQQVLDHGHAAGGGGRCDLVFVFGVFGGAGEPKQIHKRILP